MPLTAPRFVFASLPGVYRCRVPGLRLVIWYRIGRNGLPADVKIVRKGEGEGRVAKGLVLAHRSAEAAFRPELELVTHASSRPSSWKPFLPLLLGLPRRRPDPSPPRSGGVLRFERRSPGRAPVSRMPAKAPRAS